MSDAVDPVLVIGATGMLGRAFSALLAREGLRFSAVDLPEFDLCDAASIARGVAPGTRTVINCAAFTDVDGAETREAAATALNGDAVGVLARRCAEIGATLVHYSTDYVFEGDASQPYAVDHPRAPLNAYGRSKARGEELLEQAGARYLLIRTSWLYAPWGKNFVLTMRELMRTRKPLKVVDDQVGRPTSAEYLAERSLALLRRGCTGAFHVTDGGQCSWHGFASAIDGLLQARCKVAPCTSAEFPRPARRPAYSVLDLARVEAELGPSVPWQQNLAAVLRAVT
jgi:dTDP-4-dehydrorhamnose reductase